MKEEEIEQLLDAAGGAARARRAAASANAGLHAWCRRRQRNAATLRHAAMAAILLLSIFSRGTAMAHRLPDRQMNVTVPLQQKPLIERTSQIISLL